MSAQKLVEVITDFFGDSMCGIAGYIQSERERSASGQSIHKMAESLAYRGPDGEGFFVEGSVALGHRRLSIIDLVSGDQPMYNDDKSIVIVYNGEIYNYVELREELKGLGHRFKSASDTEVIIRAYEQWGTGCLQRFNGMWAFALWDVKKQTLFCARDRLGEKPFFYSSFDGAFIFGSEIKALFAYGIPKSLNREVLDAYLCFGYVPSPYTMFTNIVKLPPGHFLTVHRGRVTTHQYWDVTFFPESSARRDEPNILEEFNALFHDAVKLRMRSDVPVGAFLSGGLDSGSVVASMSALSNTPVNTFTIGFDDRSSDERALAGLVAGRLHTRHIERVVVPEDAETLMGEIARHFDEPFGDSSAIPTYIVSKLAREYVKVALTGDGGDEVLGGYTMHQGEKFSEQFAKLPTLLRSRAIPFALKCISSLPSPALNRTFERVRRVVGSANLDFVSRVEAKQSGFTRDERAALIGGVRGIRPAREFVEEAIAPVAGSDNLAMLNYWLTKVSLPDDMLCKVDRASMAHSLEVRVPFLDHRIVELLGSVSMRVKLPGYKRKHVLRSTVARELPRPLLHSKKRGFAAPMNQWVRGDIGHVLGERAQSCATAGLIDPGALNTIWDARARKGASMGGALWALAMLSYSI